MNDVMRICLNCGNPKLVANDRICLACGMVLKSATPAAPGANFSEALNHIKSGGKAYREIWCKYLDTEEQEWIGGWKPGNPAFDYLNAQVAPARGGKTPSFMVFVNIFRWSPSKQSLTIGWSPSSEDVLAEDWVLV